MQPWLDAKLNTNEPLTLYDFFKHLKFTFQSQDLRQDALSKLQYMKQGKKTVGQFVAEFTKTLIQAGQSSIDEGAKIQWFKNGLNKELRERMIGQQVFSLDEYCHRVSQIEFKLNDERRRSGRRTNFVPYNTTGHQQFRQQPKADSHDAMDWEPTVNEATARRAKWVSKSELDKRRAERRCFRCASKQHMIKNCPFAPAIRPQNQPRVQVVNVPDDAVLEDETEDDVPDEQSEN
ncbi:hypothetical protein KEM52_000116 [Ascosphaera acerosa]|nr:hypothetical protein KEM52_000116 [Ascosphaera acerosa]